MKKRNIIYVGTAGIFLSLIIILFGCVSENNQSSSREIKNVVLIIGDGMGPQQAGLLMHYARLAPDSKLKSRISSIERIARDKNSVTGISMTYTAAGLVADSAASATQLATGKMAGYEAIGYDSRGNPCRNIIEIAVKAGKSTGIISDTRLTHATPAAFYAKQVHRDMENEIAVDAVYSGIDIMLSGGLRHFIAGDTDSGSSALRDNIKTKIGPDIQIRSARKDNNNLLETAADMGYDLVFTAEQLNDSKGKKILGLFAESAFPYEIDIKNRQVENASRIPGLDEMASKTLNILSENPNGFFLIIEAGLIDWALHNNDAGATLHEMLRFNKLVETVFKWTSLRDDTLLIITGDHETGGFGFSYSASGIPETSKKKSPLLWKGKKDPSYNYVDKSVLTKIYRQKISYELIFSKYFDRLAPEKRTASELAALVNRKTEFPITDAQGEKILAVEKNIYYTGGHEYLDAEIVPLINDFKAFYPYAKDNRYNLLAREVAASQSVVWSTGTHTCTPVLFFIYGPPDAARNFPGVTHHAELGRKIIEIIEKN